MDCLIITKRSVIGAILELQIISNRNTKMIRLLH
jgi:hypothetical protein